jgi:hypothetical protein
MDMLNRSGRLSQTTAEDVAKGTADYLLNLRAVSAFTGEDSKKAQARAREASTQLAVQSKLMGMGEGAMERFQTGIANMEPFMQKALQEAVAFDGTVVDKGLNQLFALSPTREKQIFWKKDLSDRLPIFTKPSDLNFVFCVGTTYDYRDVVGIIKNLAVQIKPK